MPDDDLPPAMTWAPPGGDQVDDDPIVEVEMAPPPPPPPLPPPADAPLPPPPVAAGRLLGGRIAHHGPVAGAVLTGGGSRRMGETKALVRVREVPMARLAADALISGGAARTVLVGGDRSVFNELWMEGVPDRWPGLGPLGGIATAVLDSWPDKAERADGSVPQPGDDDELLVVVAACDQPQLSGELVADLVAALRTAPPECLVAAPVTPDGRRHPLPSVWRSVAGPLLEQLVEGGARRADSGFGPGRVTDVPASEAELRDIDSPGELRQHEADDALRWGTGPSGGA